MDDISNVDIFLLTGKRKLDNDKSLLAGSLLNTQISLQPKRKSLMIYHEIKGHTQQ